MALILAFRSSGSAPERAAASPRPSPTAQPCELILFPGVRYEYHDQEAENRSRRVRRRTASELIDLMD